MPEPPSDWNEPAANDPAPVEPDGAAETVSEVQINPSPGPPQRFQFSILQLIVLTAVVAVFCAATISVPVWLSVILSGCVAVLLPMLVTVGVVYGQGDLRTFCIGALFPSGLAGWRAFGYSDVMIYRYLGFSSGGSPNAHLWIWAGLLVVAIASALFGLIAIWLRRAIEKRQSGNPPGGPTDEPSPRSPFSEL